jgi:hypothetical protein
MKRQTKLTQQQQEQQQVEQQQSAKEAVREFATPEELLRHDAGNTAVPPQIAERLQKSVEGSPKPPPAWWRRFLGKSNS